MRKYHLLCFTPVRREAGADCGSQGARKPGLCLLPELKLLWVSGSSLLEEAVSESEPISN